MSVIRTTADGLAGPGINKIRKTGKQQQQAGGANNNPINTKQTHLT